MHKYICIFIIFSIQLFGFNPVIILSGPPGSGKGTFSQHLKEHYNYNHISAGDLVRQEILNHTPIGIEIEEIVKRGDYIPQDIMHDLIVVKIKQLASTEKPLIIDGFCRSYTNVIFLDQTLSQLGLQNKAFEIIFETDDVLCQERILSREICPNCCHVYNTQTAPSEKEAVCNTCKNPLACRINDTPKVIEKRLREYRENVEQYQMHKIKDYPYLIIDSNAPIKICLKYYSELAEEILQFDGDASCFLKHLSP